MNITNGWYTFNSDIRGSTTKIVNPSGALTTGYVYDEYGNQIKTGEEDFLNEASYTGAVYDEEIGLYYMNARYYDCTTGQFISRDTYLGNAYNPWTQNLYTYTGNNPINYTDPTGHGPIAIGAIAGATVGAFWGGISNLVTGDKNISWGKRLFTGAISGAFNGAVTGAGLVIGVGFLSTAGAGLAITGKAVAVSSGFAFGGGAGGEVIRMLLEGDDIKSNKGRILYLGARNAIHNLSGLQLSRFMEMLDVGGLIATMIGNEFISSMSFMYDLLLDTENPVHNYMGYDSTSKYDEIYASIDGEISTPLYGKYKWL